VDARATDDRVDVNIGLDLPGPIGDDTQVLVS